MKMRLALHLKKVYTIIEKFDIPYVLKSLTDFGISKCHIDRHLNSLKGSSLTAAATIMEVI